ncbi:HAD family hydrolase [Slackia heliotrinireducens]|jgi:thiamine-phosphate pyrophosphorylase|uniref:Haloacid dehalogenase superfamily protein, subfamily IA, variant 3 with third motif having DD or ED n=1 Tax=Slackia heliotrinireducens (strain ATCC 29202 / DSM 20476 / NCTC 11029 / RHS 1) TaxID=471855 RepID=C7N1B4_SLAHD|nr:HAD family phosphatase [Slackia heliotrinireducens]ACV21206.1 haloacid dehalogenase superfamily protein, subfamily IA, variant 3 with third motif having DD or ED [Slackia heliotrinireducens DSM 20476]VEG98640.1 Phosphatase YniC [Slackia heliotrinireducens]
MHVPGIDIDIQGAIFDLDGTLLDSMPYWNNLGEEYLIRRGKVPNDDIKHHFRRMTLEQSAEYMQQTYGLSETIDQIMEGVVDGIVDSYRFEIPLKPGARELFSTMKSAGAPMVVATASERRLVEAALTRLGVIDLFEGLFICSEVGASKTEPLVYEAALAHLGTRREHTLIFEDTLHACQTAKRAGFPVLAALDPANECDREAIVATADAWVESLEQLL